MSSMTRKVTAILATVLAVSSVACQHKYGRSSIPFTRQWRLNRECAVEGRALWDKRRNDAGQQPPIIEAFFSAKVDTCVQVEVDELHQSYDIRDVTHGFMRDEDFDIRIFHCGREGVGSAILSRVREFHGYVADKGYNQWQDDGEGGPPLAVKTPDHQYSRDECERLLGKKLDEL
jgi:hypothetical protein